MGPSPEQRGVRRRARTGLPHRRACKRTPSALSARATTEIWKILWLDGGQRLEGLWIQILPLFLVSVTGSKLSFLMPCEEILWLSGSMTESRATGEEGVRE